MLRVFDLNEAALLTELTASVKKCRACCPWTKEQTVASFAHELSREAQEVLDALNKNDVINLREELGDVLWDVLMTAHIAEEQGLFTTEQIFADIVDKMKRRKPYVFEGKQVTLEEADVLWTRAKEQEKLINGKKNISEYG